MIIENENLLKDQLVKGINLFLGAGFSLLAYDQNNNPLPTGKRLLEELQNEFPEISEMPNIAKACTLLENTPKRLSFYDYLNKRFIVKNFDEAYKVLDTLNINNIFTTNIDDLVFNIYLDSKKHFVNDTSIRGELRNESAINYYPLHGCIRNKENDLIFSNIKISTAYVAQKDEWQGLRRTVANQSIIFWGWDFNDTDVIEAIYKDKQKAVQDNIYKWIVLYKPKEYEKNYYRSLNFNIIEADTISLLKYFSTVILIEKREFTKLGVPKEWCIPQINTQPSYPIENFFQGDVPRWSYIFSSRLSKIHYFKDIYDLILNGDNVIIKGIPASGKTTLLMQLAYLVEIEKNKHILFAPTKEIVTNYINFINDSECLLFVDDCLNDYDGLKLLLSNKNIQVIGCETDSKYESLIYNLLDFRHRFKVIDISEINGFDIQNIINSIPRNLKSFNSIRLNDNTIFETLRYHLNIPRLENRFANMVDYLYKVNPNATEIFLMICYAHSCGIPVSFDMIYSYLSDRTTDYQEIYDNYINQIGGIIKECYGDNFSFLSDINFDEQDYYQCRTKYLASLIIHKIHNYTLMRNVLRTFMKNVPSFKICRFDIFKTKAFDADIIYKFFSDFNDGVDFYEDCSNMDESPFLYQQAALYCSRHRRFKEAFQLIDRAKSFSNYNIFSIRNTHAIILFHSNINAESEDRSVIQTLQSSLDILEDCYENDKRKGYHAQTFADLSVRFYHRYGFELSEHYLLTAYEWLEIEKVNNDNGYKRLRRMQKTFEYLCTVLNR